MSLRQPTDEIDNGFEYKAKAFHQGSDGSRIDASKYGAQGNANKNLPDLRQNFHGSGPAHGRFIGSRRGRPDMGTELEIGQRANRAGQNIDRRQQVSTLAD